MSMSKVSERCLPFDEDLSALLDGELDAAREVELRSHLASCADCRAHLAALRGVDAVLHGLAAPVVRAELAARMAARLEAERETSRAAAASPRSPLGQEPRSPLGQKARTPLDGRVSRRRRFVRLATLVPAAAALILALLVLPRFLERPGPTTRQAARAPGSIEVARREADLASRRPPSPPAPPREPAANAPALPPGAIASEVRKLPAGPKVPLGAAAADSAPAATAGDPALAQLEAAGDDELALAIAIQDAGDVESADDLALVEQLDTVESLQDLDRGGHG
jgi:hypothetical protein